MAASASAVLATTTTKNNSYLQLRFDALRQFFFNAAQTREIQSSILFLSKEVTLAFETTEVNVSIRTELVEIAQLLCLTPTTIHQYETLTGKDFFQRMRDIFAKVSNKDFFRDEDTQTLLNNLHRLLVEDFNQLLALYKYTRIDKTLQHDALQLMYIQNMLNDNPISFLQESITEIDERGNMGHLPNQSLSLQLPDVEAIRTWLNEPKKRNDEIPSFPKKKYRCQLPQPTILGPVTYASLKLLKDIHSIDGWDQKVKPSLLARYQAANGLRYHLYQAYFEFVKLIFGFDVLSEVRKRVEVEGFSNFNKSRLWETKRAIIILGIYNSTPEDLAKTLYSLTLDTSRTRFTPYGFYGVLSREVEGFNAIIEALYWMYKNPTERRRDKDEIYFCWPNNLDAIDALLAKGDVDVNQDDDYGMTPMKLIIDDLCAPGKDDICVPAVTVDDMHFAKLTEYAAKLLHEHKATLTLTAEQSAKLIAYLNEAIQVGNFTRVNQLQPLLDIDAWFKGTSWEMRCTMVNQPKILKLLLPIATSFTLLDKANLLGQALIQNNIESAAYILSNHFTALEAETIKASLSDSTTLMNTDVNKLIDSLTTSIPEAAKAEINKVLGEKQGILDAQKRACEVLEAWWCESAATTSPRASSSSVGDSSSSIDTSDRNPSYGASATSASQAASSSSRFFQAPPALPTSTQVPASEQQATLFLTNFSSAKVSVMSR